MLADILGPARNLPGINLAMDVQARVRNFNVPGGRCGMTDRMFNVLLGLLILMAIIGMASQVITFVLIERIMATSMETRDDVSDLVSGKFTGIVGEKVGQDIKLGSDNAN